MMSEHDESHVMVPAAPEAQLIVVHAQFTLALGQTRLEWEAASRSRARRSRAVSQEERYSGRTSIPAPRLHLLGQFLHRHFGRTREMQPLPQVCRSFARRGWRVHPTARTRTL